MYIIKEHLGRSDVGFPQQPQSQDYIDTLDISSENTKNVKASENNDWSDTLISIIKEVKQ